MKKWFIIWCGSGTTVFAKEIQFIEETKTQLKFKTKSGQIVKARRKSLPSDSNGYQMLGEGNKYRTIHFIDIETIKQENFIFL